MEQNLDLDFDALISRVKSEQVDITVTIEPDRTEISITPWRPYRPICPYAGEKNREDDEL